VLVTLVTADAKLLKVKGVTTLSNRPARRS